MARLNLLIALTLLAAPAARAGVIVVDASGGGDFTTLSAAVAAAVDGDTLLVRAGDYNEPAPIVIDNKALTITGEWKSSVFALEAVFQPGLRIVNLAPGKIVVLQNLVLLGTPGTAGSPATPALELLNNVSHVRAQSLWLRAGGGGHNAHPHGAAALQAVSNASAALLGCLVSGGDGQFSPDLGVVAGNGGPGIALSAGQISAYQSFIDGGYGGGNIVGGWPQGGAGGAGIDHASGTLFLVGSSLRGGDGGISHNGGDGGAGLALGPTGVAWLLGGTFASGGDGGWSDVGPDGADGPDVSAPAGNVSDFGGSAHGFDLISPLREGQAGQLKFDGDAGDTALVFASLTLHQIPYAGYQGVLMLAPSALLGPFPMGPPGNLQVPFLGPLLPPGVEALNVHVQPAYVGGGSTVLGTARVLTLLDAGF